ncbi:MAG: Transcription termination protein NusA, partial [uncultured Ramlibacter sp.]
ESRNVDVGGSDLAREERRARRGVRRRGVGAGPGHQEAVPGRRGHPRGRRPRQRRLRDVPPLAGGARQRRPAEPGCRGTADGRQGARGRRRGGRLHRGADRVAADRPHRRHGRQAGDPAEDPRRRARDAAQRLHVARRQDLRRHRQAHGQGRHHRGERPRRGAPAPRRDDRKGEPAQRRPRA